MRTLQDLRDAVAAVDAVKRERARTATKVDELRAELVDADQELVTASEECDDLAGLHALGEATPEQLSAARLARSDASDRVRALTAALRMLGERLVAIERREVEATAACRALATEFSAPLDAEDVAGAAQDVHSLGRRLRRLARRQSLSGNYVVGQNWLDLSGDPGAILREYSFYPVELNHKLENGRDEPMHPTELLEELEQRETAP